MALVATGLVSRLSASQLDVTDDASAARLARWLEDTYGGVDVLVNNAGFAYKGNVFGAEEAQVTIGINVAGTRRVTEALLPLLRARAATSPQGARVVNVCSSAGKQRILRSDALAARFNAAASSDDVMALMAEFVADIKAGKHLDKGWPNRCVGQACACADLYVVCLFAVEALRLC